MNKFTHMLILPLFLVGLLMPFASLKAQQASPAEITPIQVYALWVNINNALMAYAHTKGLSVEYTNQLENIKEEQFEGKIPRDVFNKVGEFMDIFSSISSQTITSHGNSLEDLEEEIFSVLLPSDGQIVPAMVFFRSTIVLDFLAQDIVHHQDVRHGDVVGESISQYFKMQQYYNKNPSDVYGLVDKAIKRLQIIEAIESGE